MIKLIAPEGYKLKDLRTDTLHSEIITDEKHRDRYELVPATTEPTTEMIGG